MEKKLIAEMKFMMERLENPRMTYTEYQKKHDLLNEETFNGQEVFLQENMKKNIAAGMIAVASLASCKKDTSVELTMKFGVTSATVVDSETENAEKDFIGDNVYWVTKESMPRDREVSPQWTFCEMPTAEQIAIIASYHNYESELRRNQNPNPQPGDAVQVFDLSNVEVQEGTTTNISKESRLTGSDYYQAAWDWCKSNPHIFQNDLNNLKDSQKRPKGLLGQLNNFDAISILFGNNPTK